MGAHCSIHPDPRYRPEALDQENSALFEGSELERQRMEELAKSDSRLLSSDSYGLDPQVYARFKKEIQSFWQAPYQWGGQLPSGADCSGLVRTLYQRAANVALPHKTERLFEFGKAISVRNVAFADLLFFSDNRHRTPTHVGFYIDKGFFLHASSSRGVTLARLQDSPYADTFIAARRMIER